MKVNATTAKEERRQKMLIVTLAMLPVLLLLGLTIGALFSNLLTHLPGRHLRSRIMLGSQISDVVYNLQRERNMASFYLSSHKRNTKADLVDMYRATDQSIANIAEWPDVDKGKGQFLSRAAYMRSLNEHRYTLEMEGRSQRRELTDYSAFITVMMGWLVTSISVPEASRIYRELVAMHEAIEANNAFGLVRAYGAIFYTNGGFRSRDDYVLFTNNQALADSMLESAIKYSELLLDMHKKYVAKEKMLADTIKAMRLELTRSEVLNSDVDLVPNFERALWWFENMTLYTDNLQLMTVNVRQTIVEELEDIDTEEVSWLVILGTTLGILLGICGIMGREAIYLLKYYRQSSTVLSDRLFALDLLKELLYELGLGHLPSSIADALTRNEDVPAKMYMQLTAMSVSVTGLPPTSAANADEAIAIMNEVRLCLNQLVAVHELVLLDSASYDICVLAGLDDDRTADVHALKMARFALDLMDGVNQLSRDSFPTRNISLRIAVNTRPAILGLIEKKTVPKYHCFGDILPTLDTCEDGKIHLSPTTYKILKMCGGFIIRQINSPMSDTEPDCQPGWLVGVNDP
ncbi:hypothetical protein LSAT2_004486 [Lamellibrachia satsuma]|nr:hypothetical protein LSAT2_004486 [Lamellibrachia satsuma]